MTGMTPQRLASIQLAAKYRAGSYDEVRYGALELLNEVERLQAAWSMAEPVLTERDALLAEVDRLRAGIEDIETKADDYGQQTIVNMARALLSPQDDEQPCCRYCGEPGSDCPGPCC